MTSSNESRPMRWYAVGDPQTDLPTLLATFRHHDLLEGDRLRDDIGLVSMGDHFDYGKPGEGEHLDFAKKGLAVLEWFASHPREQVRMLVGNHDLARVQELASFSDKDFAEARALALAGQDDELRRRFPDVPAIGVLRKDFSNFSTSQRTRIQQLLAGGRLECALVGKVQGRECLLSHTGITRRERELLELDEDVSLVELVTELREWFAGRVFQAATAWQRGENVPLDLTPLHLAGVAGQEAGGWLAARPANPGRPKIEDPEWEWNPNRPRRFDPHDLLRGVLQVVGHTGNEALRRELVPWLDAELGEIHQIHSLELGPDGPRYRKGFDVRAETAMIFTDAKIADAKGLVELLRLDEAPLADLDEGWLVNPSYPRQCYDWDEAGRWEAERVGCASCGWRSTAGVAQSEISLGGMELRCRGCGSLIGFVSWPLVSKT